MRFRLVIIMAGLALASAASAQKAQLPGTPDATPTVTQPKLQLRGYETALKQMDQGQCEQAKEILFPSGVLAAGDEVAMSDIGDCYLHAAAKMSDANAAQTSREIGAGWILRAANSGLRNAQETAVRLYLDGKVFVVDPYEAGKWYMLWTANRSQMQLGPIEFDRDLLKQMNTSFTPDIWAEAKARAQHWVPITSQTSPRAP